MCVCVCVCVWRGGERNSLARCTLFYKEEWETCVTAVPVNGKFLGANSIL